MYSKIVNPKTGRQVSVKSRLGKDILRKYLFILSGGLGPAPAKSPKKRQNTTHPNVLHPMGVAPPTHQTAFGPVSGAAASRRTTKPNGASFPVDGNFSFDLNVPDVATWPELARQARSEREVAARAKLAAMTPAERAKGQAPKPARKATAAMKAFAAKNWEQDGLWSFDPNVPDVAPPSELARLARSKREVAARATLAAMTPAERAKAQAPKPARKATAAMKAFAAQAWDQDGSWSFDLSVPDVATPSELAKLARSKKLLAAERKHLESIR